METWWFTTQDTIILEIESKNENNKINMFSKGLEIENENYFLKMSIENIFRMYQAAPYFP